MSALSDGELLEMVRGDKTAPDVLATAMAVGKQIGKAIETAVKAYANEVRNRVFPSDAYTYPMCDEPAPVTKKPKMTGS